MLSLDPLTVGKKGYRELFQVGEAFEGEPLIDYAHDQTDAPGRGRSACRASPALMGVN
jgi:hypothetical protein